MKITCIIPSRIGSTRLPRKPLLPIQGKPMILWTYENARKASFLHDVIVATDSDEIAELIQKAGGNVVMTDPAIATGSERVANVASQLTDTDIIINLQGDEPFIKPTMLEKLVEPFVNGENIQMSTLAYPLTPERYEDPGAVKVITDLHQNAIYFSRAPIPYYRTETPAPVFNHMGVYAFRHDFLKLYVKLPQTPLDKAESLEQLRVLEHGFAIRVCLTQESTFEINTQQEYELAQHFQYSA